jgi:hypothetical protein
MFRVLDIITDSFSPEMSYEEAKQYALSIGHKLSSVDEYIFIAVIV